MKKKGLIISTVVMAVVLIASLTTATYAWFSTSAKTSVDQINLNVEAASSIVVGVNGVDLSASGINAASPTSYISGSGLTYDGTKWEGGNEGLGTELGLGLSFSVGAGVGTGTTGTSYVKATSTTIDKYLNKADPAHIVWVEDGTMYGTEGSQVALHPATEIFTYNNGIFTAIGSATYSASATYYLVENASTTVMDYEYTPVKNSVAHGLYTALGNSFEDLTSVTPAIINGYVSGSDSTTGATDVIDLKMATRIAKADQYGSYCTITIKSTSSYMGMATALWFEITTPNGSFAGDIFDLGYEDSDATNKAKQVHYNSATGEYTFYFMIDEFGEGIIADGKYAVDPTIVRPISIKAFVSGYDEDCNVNATGSSATIDIAFATCDSEWKPTSTWHAIPGLGYTAPVES